MKTETKPQHTPTPWKHEGCEITSENGELKIYDEGGHTEADAAYIVRCVNMHEELVDALRKAELQLDRDWGIGKSPISKMVREAIAKAEAL